MSHGRLFLETKVISITILIFACLTTSILICSNPFVVSLVSGIVFATVIGSIKTNLLYTAFLISIPFYAITIAKLGFLDSPTNITTFIIAVCIALKILFDGDFQKKFLIKINSKITIFAILSILFLTIRPCFYHFSISEAITNLSPFIYFMIPLLYISSFSDVERSFKALIVGATVAGIITIITSFGYYVDFFEEIIRKRVLLTQERQFLIGNYGSCGLLPTRGTHGIFMLCVYPYLLINYLRSKRNILLLPLIIIVLAILFSNSRSSWAALGISTMVLVGYRFSNFQSRRSYLTLSIFLLLAPLLAWLILFISVALINIFPESFYSRILIDYLALKNYSISLVGLGYRTLVPLNNRFFYIHNAFIAILLENGILGLCAFSLLFLLILYYLAKGLKSSVELYRIYSIILLSSTLGALTELQFYEGFSVKILWLFIGINFGFIMLLNKGSKERPN